MIPYHCISNAPQKGTVTIFNNTYRDMPVWVISIDRLGNVLGNTTQTIPSKKTGIFETHENAKTILIGSPVTQIPLPVQPGETFTLEESFYFQ